MAGQPVYGSGLLDLKPEVSSGSLSGFESSFAGAMGGVAKVAGAALVAGLTAAVAAGSSAILGAIGQEASGDKAAARLGLSEADSARLGEIAGEAYTNNFGESIADNQQVVAEAWRRFGDIGDEALGDVSEGAQGLADVFDQDVVGIINAADQLLINDLAPDAETAMDMVATALRDTKGPQDEVLDSINEYSAHFAQVGLDGPQVLGALTSEWATNQFAIDKTGDAIKEFGIRAIDGSKLTKESLEGIGFSVEEVEKAFAEGGPAAEDMTSDIISAIINIEDPAERARIGVGLMGTPFEDLADNAVPILSDVVEGVEGFGGTTQDVTDQAYDNVSGRLSGAWRTLKQAFVENVGEKLLPIADTFSEWVSEELPGAIDKAADWFENVFLPAVADLYDFIRTKVVPFIQNQVVPVLRSIVDTVRRVVDWFNNTSPAMKTFIMSIGAAVVAGMGILKIIGAVKAVIAIFSALKLALLANPFTALAVAVAAIATLIIMNWDEIKEFLLRAWDAIKDAAEVVGDWISDKFKQAVEFVKGLFLNFTPLGLIIKNFDKIKSLATGVWTWLRDKFRQAVDFIRGLFFNFTPLGWIIKRFDKIKSLATEVKDWLGDRVDDIVGFFSALPGRIGRAVSGLWDGIKTAFKNAMNWVIRKWNNFSFSAGFDIPDLFGGGRVEIGFDTPNIPLFHEGGMVPGAPGQEMLAILEAGERVLSRAEVAASESRRGSGMLAENLNFYGLPREMARQVGDEVAWQGRTAGV